MRRGNDMHIYRTRSTATTYIRFSAKARQELDKEMDEFKRSLRDKARSGDKDAIAKCEKYEIDF